MNDMAKHLPFSAAVRENFATTSRLREPFSQTRFTAVLATTRDKVGVLKQFSAYLTVEAFGNLVAKSVVVATPGKQNIEPPKHPGCCRIGCMGVRKRERHTWAFRCAYIMIDGVLCAYVMFHIYYIYC